MECHFVINKKPLIRAEYQVRYTFYYLLLLEVLKSSSTAYDMHVKSSSLIVHQYLGLTNILSHPHMQFCNTFYYRFESQKCQYDSYARKFVVTNVQNSMCSLNALSTNIQSTLSIIEYSLH